MSAIITTDAIVLRTIKYGESSKIVTFYTLEFGKVKGVAKGARQAKSKFGASLEPMSYVALVFYKKDHRNIQLVSQCDLIRSFHRLSDDMEKLTVGMSLVELMDKVSHDEERNEPLFALLLDSLSLLNSAERNARNIKHRFMVDMASILGFHPAFDRCCVCGGRLGSTSAQVFHIGKGGPLCGAHVNHNGLKVRLSEEALLRLSDLASCRSPMELLEMNFPASQHDETESILLGYLRYHIDGLQNLRVGRAMSKIPA
jgi:DNA repair protein RecO (recombination protein O)